MRKRQGVKGINNIKGLYTQCVKCGCVCVCVWRGRIVRKFMESIYKKKMEWLMKGSMRKKREKGHFFIYNKKPKKPPLDIFNPHFILDNNFFIFNIYFCIYCYYFFFLFPVAFVVYWLIVLTIFQMVFFIVFFFFSLTFHSLWQLLFSSYFSLFFFLLVSIVDTLCRHLKKKKMFFFFGMWE